MSQKNHSKLICIFAGASTPSDPLIIENAIALGRMIAAEGYDLIYGGGMNGVMGACATAASEGGSRIHAVTLEKYSHEPQIEGANVQVVKNEAERFELLAISSRADALFALPGGPGTLREVMQALESAVYDNGAPVILVKTPPYLDGIKNYFDSAVSAKLIKPEKALSLREWSPEQTIKSILDLS